MALNTSGDTHVWEWGAGSWPELRPESIDRSLVSSSRESALVILTEAGASSEPGVESIAEIDDRELSAAGSRSELVFILEQNTAMEMGKPG